MSTILECQVILQKGKRSNLKSSFFTGMFGSQSMRGGYQMYVKQGKLSPKMNVEDS